MHLANDSFCSSSHAGDFFFVFVHHVMMHILFYDMYDFLSPTWYCWCMHDLNLGVAVIHSVHPRLLSIYMNQYYSASFPLLDLPIAGKYRTNSHQSRHHG